MSPSEGLHWDRIQQGHVLGSSDWQLVCRVVGDDLGDGRERRAVLSEDVAAVWGLGELHMHEAFAAPDNKETVQMSLNLPNRNVN